MRCNILWILTLLAPNALAAPNFASVEVLGTTPQSCNLQTATAADLDGDGRTDLLTADNCSQTGESIGTHSVHMNRGVLGFETVGTVPGADVIADFDGDGLPDLAWLESDPTSGAGTTRWSALLARGLGDGQFGTPALIASLTAPSSRLVSGDLEGDGDPDLVLSWPYGLRALRNDAGTFIAAPDLNFHDGSLVDQTLYFDSDPFVDLMAAPGVVLLGGGDGSFPGRGRIQGPEGFLTFSTSRAWNLDLDGDGDHDLLAHGNYFDVVPNASLLSLMRGADGVLRYTASLYMDRFESSFHPSRSAALVDLDGDGRLELAYQSRLYQCFVPFACPAVLNGPTTFASVEIAADGAFTQQAGFRGGRFTFGDVDGDGRVDAVGVFGSNIVWRRSVTTPNSAPIAPAEARLRMAFNANFEDQWLHIGASDIDDNVIRYQTLASTQRPNATLSYANGWVHYAPGTSTLGGTETFLLETDDGAGGRAQTRLVVEVQGVGRAGGGAPDLLSLGVLAILGALLGRRRAGTARTVTEFTVGPSRK